LSHNLCLIRNQRVQYNDASIALRLQGAVLSMYATVIADCISQETAVTL